MGPEMVRGNEIDIMHSSLNQFQNFRLQLAWRKSLSQIFLGNLIILTKKATGRTTGKEDGARPLVSGNGRFFAEMGANGGNSKFSSLATVSHLAGKPVDTALSWAEGTIQVRRKGIH